jgi:hypothetical protein
LPGGLNHQVGPGGQQNNPEKNHQVGDQSHLGQEPSKVQPQRCARGLLSHRSESWNTSFGIWRFD